MDEQDKASTSSRGDDTQARVLDDSFIREPVVEKKYGSWWRLGVTLDRVFSLILTIIYAALWGYYLG